MSKAARNYDGRSAEEDPEFSDSEPEIRIKSTLRKRRPLTPQRFRELHNKTQAAANAGGIAGKGTSIFGQGGLMKLLGLFALFSVIILVITMRYVDMRLNTGGVVKGIASSNQFRDMMKDSEATISKKIENKVNSKYNSITKNIQTVEEKFSKKLGDEVNKLTRKADFVASAKEQQDKLDGFIQSAEASLAALRKSHEDNLDRIKDGSAKMSQVEGEMKNNFENIRNGLEQAEEKAKTTENSLSETINALSDLKNDLEAYKRAALKHREKIENDFGGKVDALDAKVEKKHAEYEKATNSRISALETKAKEHIAELSTLGSKLAHLGKQISTLGSKSEKLDSKIEKETSERKLAVGNIKNAVSRGIDHGQLLDKPNAAAEMAGATISFPTSSGYESSPLDGWMDPFRRLTGAKLAIPMDTVLKPKLEGGDCWKLKGASGNITIRLAYKTKPVSFGFSDVPAKQRPNPTSSVKEFAVYGGRGNKFGTYTFEKDGEAQQLFKHVSKNTADMEFLHIRFEIISNWGNDDFTCIPQIVVLGERL